MLSSSRKNKIQNQNVCALSKENSLQKQVKVIIQIFRQMTTFFVIFDDVRGYDQVK